MAGVEAGDPLSLQCFPLEELASYNVAFGKCYLFWEQNSSCSGIFYFIFLPACLLSFCMNCGHSKAQLLFL